MAAFADSTAAVSSAAACAATERRDRKIACVCEGTAWTAQARAISMYLLLLRSLLCCLLVHTLLGCPLRLLGRTVCLCLICSEPMTAKEREGTRESECGAH